MLQRHDDRELDVQEVIQLAKSPMCFIWAVCSHHKTDIFDGNIAEFDNKVRAAQESFIIHTWYGYLTVRKSLG